MMSDMTSNAAHPPLTSSSLDRLLHALRAAPVRYYVLAGSWAVLILAFHLMTPWHPPIGNGNPGTTIFFGRLAVFAGVMMAAAPVLAVRWPGWATALALLPLCLALLTDYVWPFTLFMALLGVTMTATWRSRLRALVPGGAALGLVLLLLSGRGTMLVMDGALITFAGTWSDASLPLGLYLSAVTAAYGLGLWMRASALKARRLAGLTARAAQVEDEATMVGERARLARDLHDVVAHHVSLIAVRAETAPYTCPDMGSETRTVLAEIAADARAALEELRGVLGILRRAEDGSPRLGPQPELSDVSSLVEKARGTGMQVSLDGDLQAPVGAALGYVAYRVVQEALTNARRHAAGRPVTVAVLAEPDRLRVRVANPYLAEGPRTSGGGGGLVGMRERVEALGGRLRTGVEGDHFVVEANLPRGAL